MRTSSARLFAFIFLMTRARWISHGALADAEIDGDGLVGETVRNSLEHLRLPWRQRVQPHIEFGELGASLASSSVEAQGLVHLGKQLLAIDRQGQEVQRTTPDCAYGRRNVAMARDEHDGQIDAHPGQLVLQIEAAHPRHANVQEQAARYVAQSRQAVEEGLRTGKDPAGDPGGS